MDKKVFFYKNMPVYAVGTLIYKKSPENNEIEFLLVKNCKNKFEDIGGKTENTDDNIYQTACREMEEETNKIVKGCDISERIKKTRNVVYNMKSKYLVFIIQANNNEEKLESSIFDNIEYFSKQKRTVEWVPFKIYKKYANEKMLNFRLMVKYLFNRLETINFYNSQT
jgi:ADP-ribose pyrophosphatase YjhB (NUDIX family)